ncbi:hypothetical protein MUK42_23901 [Musa troglodytarum]|uniref:Uncharacterized protein n=1 Tax=Musa troglodytarum TaxID=320322 RepID=A0A9E7JXG0_9LILI|nr:hypothetical protein MUK42_23901 [Musa troglodytarum]
MDMGGFRDGDWTGAVEGVLETGEEPQPARRSQGSSRGSPSLLLVTDPPETPVEKQKNTRGELLALLRKRRSQELGFDCIQRQGHERYSRPEASITEAGGAMVVGGYRPAGHNHAGQDNETKIWD